MEEVIQDTGVNVPVAGEQSIEQTQINESSEQQTGVTTEVAAQTTEEQNYGPAIKAEIARREAQIEKKYQEKYQGFDEAKTKAETYQQQLDRIAKYYKFESHDEYMKALEEAEREREIEAEAVRLGVDPSVIKEYVQPLNQKLSQYEQQLAEIQKQENIRNVEAQLTSLKAKYDDFGKYEQSVIDIAIQKGYSLEDSYIIASHHDKVESVKTQAEQEAIQKLQQNAATSTGPLGNESPDEKFGYMSMTPAERRTYRDKVKRGQT